MTRTKKNALLLSSMFALALIIVLVPDLALADAAAIGAKVEKSVNDIISIVTNIGYGLCTIGAIVGGILWGTGNPRGKGIVLGAIIGAGVIAVAGELVKLLQ